LLLISKQSATISEGDSSRTHSSPKITKLVGELPDLFPAHVCRADILWCISSVDFTMLVVFCGHPQKIFATPLRLSWLQTVVKYAKFYLTLVKKELTIEVA